MTSLQLQEYLANQGISVEIANAYVIDNRLETLSKSLTDSEIADKLTGYISKYKQGGINSPSAYLTTYICQLVNDLHYRDNAKKYKKDYKHLLPNPSRWHTETLTSNALLWLINQYLFKQFEIDAIVPIYRDYYRKLIDKAIDSLGYESAVKRLCNITLIAERNASAGNTTQHRRSLLRQSIYNGLRGVIVDG